MKNKCPNCKCDKSAWISITSSDGYSGMCHQGTGALYPSICLNCGVIYVDENRLERIRESEGFDNG